MDSFRTPTTNKSNLGSTAHYFSTQSRTLNHFLLHFTQTLLHSTTITTALAKEQDKLTSSRDPSKHPSPPPSTSSQRNTSDPGTSSTQEEPQPSSSTAATDNLATMGARENRADSAVSYTGSSNAVRVPTQTNNKPKKPVIHQHDEPTHKDDKRSTSVANEAFYR